MKSDAKMAKDRKLFPVYRSFLSDAGSPPDGVAREGGLVAYRGNVWMAGHILTSNGTHIGRGTLLWAQVHERNFISQPRVWIGD